MLSFLEVGYRIEAVKSGVSRITMIYSFDPQGHIAQYPYFAKKMEEVYIQSLPGLRDMLCQIPEYHILNLIERIVKGIRSSSSESSEATCMDCYCSLSVAEPSILPPAESSQADIPALSKQSSSLSLPSEPSVSMSSQPAEELSEEVDEEESSALLLPPYITNTVPHASECDLMVSSFTHFLTRTTAGKKWMEQPGMSVVHPTPPPKRKSAPRSVSVNYCVLMSSRLLHVSLILLNTLIVP